MPNPEKIAISLISTITISGLQPRVVLCTIHRVVYVRRIGSPTPLARQEHYDEERIDAKQKPTFD